MVTIVEQLQQNFYEKYFVRKYFVLLLFVWIVFSSSKMNFFAMKFILLAGHDCWKSLLKLQLYRAILSSYPTKNS